MASIIEIFSSSAESQDSGEQLGPHSDPRSSIVAARKRGLKRSTVESEERPWKRTRTSQSPAESYGEKRRRSRRRHGRRHGRRENHYPSEAPSNQAPTVASCCINPGTSLSTTSAPTNTRAAFRAQYVEGALLGEGGFGSVFSGHRRHDNLPVAIKHIRQDGRITKLVDNNNTVPLEVALMLKLRPASEGTSAVVALLDWYDLRDELILVMERPDPCMDLLGYLTSKGSTLDEFEVKIIMKQLVCGLSEIHSKGVFHNDIKLENILCEHSLDDPSIRIIDFGCGTFLHEGMYTTSQGTPRYTSPEWFLDRCYRAEPATVWQLGVVLFLMLHLGFPFKDDTDEIIYKDVCVRDDLSFDCRDLLLSCLNKDPAARPSLETLKHHSWLRDVSLPPLTSPPLPSPAIPPSPSPPFPTSPSPPFPASPSLSLSLSPSLPPYPSLSLSLPISLCLSLPIYLPFSLSLPIYLPFSLSPGW